MLYNVLSYNSQIWNAKHFAIYKNDRVLQMLQKNFQILGNLAKIPSIIIVESFDLCSSYCIGLALMFIFKNFKTMWCIKNPKQSLLAARHKD